VSRAIYLDSSSLLKTLWHEPESPAVLAAIAREDRVVVSVLAELEVEVQLRAKRLAGALTKRRYDAYRAALQSLRQLAPFEFRTLTGDVFRLAIQQHVTDNSAHCRSLDRLHLAAMAELGVRRLMTNDAKQAVAARAMSYDVVSPAHEA
jgi:predicted nucleic acid-binding protein